MKEFRPANRVQQLAYVKRRITSAAEFARSIKGKEWNVKRPTAYHWWDNGIPKNMYLASARKLAEYFGVTLDELIRDA